MTGSIIEEVRCSLVRFIRKILGGAIVYANHRSRKTVSTLDVVHALKREGHTLYGFGHYAMENAEEEDGNETGAEDEDSTEASSIDITEIFEDADGGTAEDAMLPTERPTINKEGPPEQEADGTPTIKDKDPGEMMRGDPHLIDSDGSSDVVFLPGSGDERSDADGKDKGEREKEARDREAQYLGPEAAAVVFGTGGDAEDNQVPRHPGDKPVEDESDGSSDAPSYTRGPGEDATSQGFLPGRALDLRTTDPVDPLQAVGDEVGDKVGGGISNTRTEDWVRACPYQPEDATGQADHSERDIVITSTAGQSPNNKAITTTTNAGPLRPVFASDCADGETLPEERRAGGDGN